MTEFDFTLKYRFERPDTNPEQFVDALAEAGCDDATVGIGQAGRIALNFCRESASAVEAVTSAIQDVQKAIPNARLVEVTPDYVGITDIAGLFGFSRQYMRKLLAQRGSDFPEPIHEGKPSLWHLFDVLFWFKHHETREVEQSLLELAEINMQLNLYRSCLKAANLTGDSIQLVFDAPDKTLKPTLDLLQR